MSSSLYKLGNNSTASVCVILESLTTLGKSVYTSLEIEVAFLLGPGNGNQRELRRQMVYDSSSCVIVDTQ